MAKAPLRTTRYEGWIAIWHDEGEDVEPKIRAAFDKAVDAGVIASWELGDKTRNSSRRYLQQYLRVDLHEPMTADELPLWDWLKANTDLGSTGGSALYAGGLATTKVFASDNK